MKPQAAVDNATHNAAVSGTRPIVIPPTNSATRTAVQAKIAESRHSANSVSPIIASASLLHKTSIEISSMPETSTLGQPGGILSGIGGGRFVGGGFGAVQVLTQASPLRLVRIFDRMQTLVQFTSLQGINSPEGTSTLGVIPPLQHPTSKQTSSNPSLAIVPGGSAHKKLFVVKGRQLSAAVTPFVYSAIARMAVIK
jgi:hypothetical protein